MTRAKKKTEKFKFDLEFQWEIIRYTLKDKHGYKALTLYKPEYFDLQDQQVIAKGVSRFFKRKKRVPASSMVLNEELNSLFRTKDYAQALLEADRERIKAKVKKLYKSVVQDGDEILHKCKLFASYVEFKRSLEEVDLDNFTAYEQYSKKIQKAINLGMEVDENKGSFLVAGHQGRITDRYNTEPVIPTPWRQMNKLTNAGGYEMGSVVVIMDQPKQGKTTTLVNLAVASIKKRGNKQKIGNARHKSAKKVIYFDLENGETAITVRMDQSVLGKSKLDILSHKNDDKLKKMYRQFRRYEGEVFVKRMPRGCTTDDLQKEMDTIYTEYGIKFEVAIVDYVALMNSLNGAKEDFQRISEAYLDIKNWALKNQLDIVYTAHHVVRGAYKKRFTKFDAEDLAKCIDIERHVDAIYGIQQSKLDKEQNVIRLEIIEQRDGYNFGRILLWVNIKTQQLREFSREEEQKYNEQIDEMGELDEGSKGRTFESDAEKGTRERKQRKAKSDI